MGAFNYTLQSLKGVAFDVKRLRIYCVPLRTHLLRKSQNCVDFSASLSTVILVSIDSTSHNVSMSLIQYQVSLQFGCTFTN